MSVQTSWLACAAVAAATRRAAERTILFMTIPPCWAKSVVPVGRLRRTPRFSRPRLQIGQVRAAPRSCTIADLDGVTVGETIAGFEATGLGVPKGTPSEIISLPNKDGKSAGLAPSRILLR